MISSRAIDSIEWLFKKSLQDNSASGVENGCVVTLHKNLAPPAESAGRRLVALTISSYVFRIVTLFDFCTDAATVAHMTNTIHQRDELLDEQTLLDAYTEYANMICGEVNRGLSAPFRHIGMSTPFILESTCLSYLSILKPAQVSSIEVAINDTVRFTVIVGICVDSASSLDFQIDRVAQEEVSSGELELF